MCLSKEEKKSTWAGCLYWNVAPCLTWKWWCNKQNYTCPVALCCVLFPLCLPIFCLYCPCPLKACQISCMSEVPIASSILCLCTLSWQITTKEKVQPFELKRKDPMTFNHVFTRVVKRIATSTRRSICEGEKSPAEQPVAVCFSEAAVDRASGTSRMFIKCLAILEVEVRRPFQFPQEMSKSPMSCFGGIFWVYTKRFQQFVTQEKLVSYYLVEGFHLSDILDFKSSGDSLFHVHCRTWMNESFTFKVKLLY